MHGTSPSPRTDHLRRAIDRLALLALLAAAACGSGRASSPGSGSVPEEEPEQEPALTLAYDCASNAELVHPLFATGMVIQRDAWSPIWGCAAAGARVTVAVAGRSKTTTADETGLWKLRLEPMSAGGPYTLEIATDSESRTFDDVMVGDVWLCSGQSNMVMTVSGVLQASEEIADAANYGAIRLMKVPSVKSPVPLQTFGSAVEWKAASPESVPSFSATCYFFARELYETEGVPMGLVLSAWNGTSIQWWMSADVLADDVDFSQAVADVEAGNLPADGFYVSSLYNGMIAPLAPYALRGVVWYQGESNAGAPELYQRLLPNLIGDWRDHLGQRALPFLVVQLPRYGAVQQSPVEAGWASLREAQMLTATGMKGVGLAVAIDTGEADDLHPKDKQDVGGRLAVLARGLVYGEEIAYQGPTYRGMSVEGGQIRISFDNASGGLMVGSKEPLEPVQEVTGGTLEGFAIAGADGKFVWGTAAIEGSTVVVSSPSVAAPVAVRYGWANTPTCNLYGKEGLPASPFRTDTE